jgi:selenocysteine lyase/cysteine desulfurase
MLKALFNFPHNILKILDNQEKIMSQLDDLNALVTSLQSDVTGVQADVATVIALLQAVQVPGVDLTDALAKLGAIHTALGAVDANLKAVEPVVVPPVAS